MERWFHGNVLLAVHSNCHLLTCTLLSTLHLCSYSLGDKVERWLNDLLCLDAAEHTPPPPARLPHPGALAPLVWLGLKQCACDSAHAAVLPAWG